MSQLHAMRLIKEIARQTLARRTFSAPSKIPPRAYHATAGLPNGDSGAGCLSKDGGSWNREESKHGEFKFILDMSPWSAKREARILSLSDPADGANDTLHKGKLPYSSRLLGIGTDVSAFGGLEEQKPNVLFVSPSCPQASRQLPLVLEAFPSIEWVHCRSAGIDFVVSNELSEVPADRMLMTNAKGQFSSSLAEYCMMAMSYFAKDLPRLLRQKGEKNWEKYDVQELRGRTLGVVGYGDIGRATARLAHAYGMRVVALRRCPDLSRGDPLCDEVYGTSQESLCQLMSESDYVVCSAPLTPDTHGMVGSDAFRAAREGQVFINLGRGPVVDEAALVEALGAGGSLRGAALDVFSEEPLPRDHALWELDNVLLSPHNMDQTATFMHEATEFFVHENLPRYICGRDLLNPVDARLGY